MGQAERLWAAVQQQRWEDAVRLAQETLRERPGDSLALYVQAIGLREQGRLDEAQQIFETLADGEPGVPEHWSNLGNLYRERGLVDKAGESYRRALELAPEWADAHFNFGLWALQQGELQLARQHLVRSCELDPRSVEARLFAAESCFECGEQDTAEHLLEGLVEAAPGLAADVLMRLGGLLGRLGKLEQARRLLERARLDARMRDQATARLVELYERTNDVQAAADLARELPDGASISATDVHADILGAQALLAARQDRHEVAARALEGVLALPLHKTRRAQLLFTLARTHAALGKHDAAMEVLSEAHRMQFEMMRGVFPELCEPDAQPLPMALARVDAEAAAVWRGQGAKVAAKSPIFIVGFPRSGTTLLEQMLDAHPDLCSMDERVFLQNAIGDMRNLYGLKYPEQLHRLSEVQVEDLRERYWKRVSAVVKVSAGQRLVDKNPLNILRLPMLLRLFPDAKVILALRHSCDVLLSCYMQSFQSPGFQVMCADLAMLARGYVNAFEGWLYHSALLQPDELRLRYEDLITDFDKQVTVLGRFLGLEDVEPLHRFSEHARAKGYISTPSYAQVVAPINRRAMGRWQAYRKYFEPVLPILTPILERLGYAT